MEVDVSILLIDWFNSSNYFDSFSFSSLLILIWLIKSLIICSLSELKLATSSSSSFNFLCFSKIDFYKISLFFNILWWFVNSELNFDSSFFILIILFLRFWVLLEIFWIFSDKFSDFYSSLCFLIIKNLSS